MLSFDFKTGDVGKFAKQFKELNSTQQVAILTSKNFTETQKNFLAKSAGVTLTTNGQVVATNTLSASQTTATTTTNGLSVAFEGLWASMKPVLTAILTNPFTWAIAGGLALAGVIDYLTVSYDEANKALDEANEKYKETESNISSLNDELTTNEEKIKELKKLESDGTITDSQKEELENLENKNAQLETQIALQKELLELQNQDKAEAAKDVANAESHSVAQSVKMGDETGKSTYKGTVGTVTDTEAIKEDLALIDEYESKVSDLETELIEAKQAVSNAESPFAKWTAELKVSNIEREIQKYKDSLTTLYTDLQTRSANAQETLESLKLDPETNVDEIKVYETALASMQEQLVEVEETIEKTNKVHKKSFSKEEMISQLNDMSEGFEELDKIYASIKDEDPFDFKLLDDDNFKETFGGLGEVYSDFVEQITTTPDDIKACQSAFDNLVTAWINNTGILDGVTEENANLTKSMLKQMGVANAEELVTEALIHKHQQLAAQKFLSAGGTDRLSNATAEEIEEILAEGEAAGTTREMLAQMYLAKLDINNLQLNTQGEIDQIIALANAAGTSTQYVNQLRTALANLNSAPSPDELMNMPGGATKYRYQQEKSVENLLGKIKNSALNASTFYAKSSGSNASYTGGSTSNKEGSSSSPKIFDWIEVALSRVQRTITNLGKTVSATWKSWTDRNTALKNQISAVTKEIELQEKAYDAYMSLANSGGLSDYYKNLVMNGAIDISTISDETLVEQIQNFQDYYEKALAAKDATIDLQDELANLSKTKFDNIIQQVDDQLLLIEHEENMLNSAIEAIENRGYLVSAKMYDSLIQNEEKRLEKLKAEYTALNNAMGGISEGTEQWYEMYGEILGVKEEIQESTNALIEFNNTIRDLEWEVFDKLQERIGSIISETEFFIELMSNEKMFDDNGITEHGQAILGLHAVNYNVYMKQAEEYKQMISEINDELANDPNNQILLDKKQEYIELQQDSILSAQDELESIISLKKEGYNVMLESMQKIIDKRKEILNSQKD